MFYDLTPANNQTQASFYGKAKVEIKENGDKVLYSYNTKIATMKGAEILRHWDGWTKTTGRHIFAFCGMRKADFEKLPIAE